MGSFPSKLDHFHSPNFDYKNYDKIYLADDSDMQCNIMRTLFPEFIIFNPFTNKNLMELNDLLENYIKTKNITYYK